MTAHHTADLKTTATAENLVTRSKLRDVSADRFHCSRNIGAENLLLWFE